MKPVIYHLVERLRDGFLNCGARTVNETGSCWGKSANMDYANKKINPFSNNCVKTQVCKDAKWQKTHMNRGLYESAQATMSHIVVEQQKSRAKFSARLRSTHTLHLNRSGPNLKPNNPTCVFTGRKGRKLLEKKFSKNTFCTN